MDEFQKRKENVLSKNDKSSKGSWDKPILKLCEKLNKKKNYYTTSTCSGRLTIIRNVSRDKRGVVLKSYHDTINFFELKIDLDGFIKKEKDIVLKFEPSIIHVACKDVESMKSLFEIVKNAGWKNVSAISFDSRYVLEARCSERLELPIVYEGKLIIDDNFLEICVSESNKKLKSCWDKINKFEKLL
ncbi:hypothetical protein COU57_01635 [Candidatus Pacearchaeota archaeon CG10_big_fil_rev_8_21_14_0_10_32_14]|nr:MAG: hypothetical protein COU57_01635 [Candidatus Pacearchaeota archaeon CG10_big_fil_rev_8_21_14_0_10_32_14]